MKVQVMGHSQIPWSFGIYDSVEVELYKVQFQYHTNDGAHYPSLQVSYIIARSQTSILHVKDELAGMDM